LLRDAVEGSPHGLTVRDADGSLLICNRAYSQIYGLEPDDLLGKTRSEVGLMIMRRIRQYDGIPVTDPEAEFEGWLERLETIADNPVEIELDDGRWLLASGHHTPDGGIALTRTDITKQKRVELALRESEQRFRYLLESHPLPVYIVELESGKILYESPASAKMFRHEWPSEKERYVTDYYVDPTDRAPYIEELRATGEIRGFDILLKREDGTEFWVSATSKVLTLDKRQCVISGLIDLTERRQREEELRRIRETLEDAIESLSEGFALFDSENKLLLCNTRYRDFHQVSADIIEPGMDWVDLIESDLEKGLYVEALGREADWLRDRKKMRRELQTNLEYEQSDGRWVSGANRPTRQGGIVVTLTDITDRKAQETESRQSREMLEDAIEALGEGFVIWDDSDRLMMCNQQYLEINRICADVLEPGVHFEEFMRAGAERGQYVDAVGRVDEWVEERLQARRQPGTSAEYQLSNGRWIFTTTHTTRQGAKVAIRLDITDRKEMEQALQESEGLVRRVLESCPVPLAMNRLDNGEYIYISPSNADLLGIDVVDGPFFSPDSYVDPKIRESYVNRLRKEKRINDLEVQRIRADGTSFWVSMSSQLIDYKGEEMIVSSIFDLTERNAVAEEMARQRQALYQSEKLSALGSLLASVAHELNNPLSIVVAQSMLLEELASDPDISKRATKISTAADRCARIVKTFLAMARQEPAEYRAVKLNEVVKSALDVTGHALRSSGIEVSSRLASDLPSLQGDADQLTQVVTNLILNAQQAMEGMEGDGWLKITTSHRPRTRELVVKIKDNGPGIGTDVRSRIFEPFFTTKKMEAGTGIGLAICHRIIESHGGTISVEDTRDSGASFAIRFPESTRSSEETPSTERPEASRATFSILVVDDEADVLDVLADILRGDGHDVDTADSGDAALERLRDRDFAVVVSDLRMPGLDGPGLYEKLRQELPAVIPKLMFLTGDTMSAGAKNFLDESGRPYLEKPINPRELRSLVRQVAGNGAR
jgi:PAS domain S-box-containing protein